MNPYTPPPHRGLDILYQDGALLVVNKPGGLLSVPGRGPDKQDCLMSRVQRELPQALNVHRLDMETSGLMVLALGKNSQRDLGRLFEQRKVHKRYVAVVNGHMQTEQGEIDLPLGADWLNRPRQKVDPEHGKPSTTRYRVVARDNQNNATRVELEPLTGRTHQLRVHLHALGHSILGDSLYADQHSNRCSGRLQLHATTLAFTHPLNNAPLHFSSATPF